MMTNQLLIQRFETVFTPAQARVLAESITEAYADLIKAKDFSELKAIVKDLAEAQQRTEMRLEQLAEAQQRTEMRLEQLAEAQQRTDARLEQLAEAQQRTDARLEQTNARLDRLTEVVTGLALHVGQLTQTVEKLVKQVAALTGEVGGLSRSMSYALENEAYRFLPAFLERQYGIILRERIIRTEMDGREINFFARGERDGRPVCLVGEAKLQLDERRQNKREAEKVFAQLQAQAETVRKLYPDCEVILILVTHYARPAFLKRAQELGILVVQSYEW
jgi:chromosome segregation ATPase